MAVAMLSHCRVQELYDSPLCLGPPLHALHDAETAAMWCGTLDPKSATHDGVLEDLFHLAQVHKEHPLVARAVCYTLAACCNEHCAPMIAPHRLARMLRPFIIRQSLRLHGAACAETALCGLKALAFSARFHSDNAAMAGVEEEVLFCHQAHPGEKRVTRAVVGALAALANNAFLARGVLSQPGCVALLPWMPRPSV